MYPDKIPIVVGRANILRDPTVIKQRFLVHDDVKFGQFIIELRKQMIALKPTEQIFCFIKNISLIGTMNMNEIYDRYKDADGILYVTYTIENTFG
jgi:GABA(A) receptor-associated protein